MSIMKRIFLPIFLTFGLLFAATDSNAQFIQVEDDSGLILGFNVGGTWQQSDLKSYAGVGFGATLGCRLYRQQGSFLSVDARFRYLWGQNYGVGLTRNRGLANNAAFNGTLNPSLDYESSPGYMFDNYKMELNDFSLEAVLTLNSLRERTGIIIQGFAGIGLTQYKVFTDQGSEDLFGFNNAPYDYTTIDTTASPTTIESQLESLWDGTYETRADGNAETQVRLMPHLGVALGYQFGPHFSMGIEHRVSFARNDAIDGVQWNNDNSAMVGQNDRYHYTALVFRFRLGRGGGGYNPPDRPIDNYSQNPNPNPNPDPITPTPTVRKPVVNITDPISSPHETSSSIHILRANVFYVDGWENITFKQNGVISTDFTFNPATNEFISSVNLQPGSNVYEITGTNSAGSDYESTIIVRNQTSTTGYPPIVTIINPPHTPYNTTNSVFNVNATVLNVSGSSDITFLVNGVSQPFSYTTSTSMLSATISLNEGNNIISITGTNGFGTDSEAATIVYNVEQVIPPPVVNIQIPTSDPHTTNSNQTTVQATVLNVASSADITVTLNGANQNWFSFSPYTSILEFDTDELVEGANIVQITGTNSVGSDTDDITIVYEKPQAEVPPNVIITIPHNSPHTVTESPFTVKAIIENVKEVSGASCTINGVPTSAFSFDPMTTMFSVPVNLILGANIITVTGTNGAGTDSESTTIIYIEDIVPCDVPIISVSQPSTNPMTTYNSSGVISATVMNVSGASDITMTANGSPTTFSFNPVGGVLTSNQTMIVGTNVFEIVATNNCGTISKHITIVYEEPTLLPPPEITFTNPSSFPHTSENENITVTGTVLHVNTSSDIQVFFNGVPTTSFTYTPSTDGISIPLTLNEGGNTLKVIATNTVGTDMESVIINYMPLDPPVITLEVPTTNIFSTPNETEPVQFTVTNITGPSDVHITQNGNTITSYSYDPGPIRFNFTAYLVDGANYFDITATNTVGMDHVSFQINYDADTEWETGESPTDPPTVTITNPAGTSTFATASPTFTVTAETERATSVQVIVNGISTTSYTFDGTNVAVPVTLNAGINKISIRAINSVGHADALAKLDYTPAEPDAGDDIIRPWDREEPGGDVDGNGGRFDGNDGGTPDNNTQPDRDGGQTPTIITPVEPEPDRGGGGGTVTPTITTPVEPEPDRGGGGGTVTPTITTPVEPEPNRGGGGGTITPTVTTPTTTTPTTTTPTTPTTTRPTTPTTTPTNTEEENNSRGGGTTTTTPNRGGR